MNKCLNCERELKHIEGRRKKKFCNEKCKGEYWRKQNKEPKYVQKEKFDKVVAELEELKFAKSVPEKKGHKYPLEPKDVQATQELRKELETPKKHKLWKEGDPPEGTNAFYLRKGCRTYEQLEKINENER